MEKSSIIGGGVFDSSFAVQDDVLSQQIVLDNTCSSITSNSNKSRMSSSESTDNNTPMTIGSTKTVIGASTQIRSTLTRDEVQNEDLGFMHDITIILCCTIL